MARYTEDEIDQLWEDFKNIPVSPFDELSENFLHFELGDNQRDVLLWFDSVSCLPVYYRLYPQEKPTMKETTC